MAKKITLRRSTFFVLLFCCAVSVVIIADHLGRAVFAKDSSDSDSYGALKTFTDVIALVQKNYVEEVDMKKLVDGAIKGMLVSLDPHSSYLPSDMYKELQVETKGEFGGLGIEITVKDGLLTVVSPIEDSPAAKAGVKPGDQIIKIGDEFTKDLSLVDAVKKMRGPQGTPIGVSVHREGYKELIPLTIIRDIIKVKSVRFRPLDEGYAYIRLAQFQDGSSSEFEAALKDLEKNSKDKAIHGLIIDLRNNPGGLLTEAIRVSDIFLQEGVIVYTDGRLESQKQKYYAHDDGNEPKYPVIVLVNGGSASASEIVAGALQDHHRALVLGTQSFGKGSVQTILPMDNDSALRLTTALYYTKSGRSIQAQGISPDIVVAEKRFPKDSEELLEGDEYQLKEKDLPGAFKNPKETGATSEPAAVPTKKPKKPAAGKGDKNSSLLDDEEKFSPGSRSAMTIDLPTLLKQDPQLDEALRLLKTWHIFQGKPAVQAQTPTPTMSPTS